MSNIGICGKHAAHNRPIFLVYLLFKCKIHMTLVIISSSLVVLGCACALRDWHEVINLDWPSLLFLSLQLLPFTRGQHILSDFILQLKNITCKYMLPFFNDILVLLITCKFVFMLCYTLLNLNYYGFKITWFTTISTGSCSMKRSQLSSSFFTE